MLFVEGVIFAQPEMIGDWKLALKASVATQEPHLSFFRLLEKAWRWVDLVADNRVSIAILILLSLFFTRAATRLKRLQPVLITVVVAYLVRKIYYAADLNLERGFIGLAAVSSFFFLCQKNVPTITSLVLVSTLLAQVCMSLSSSNGAWISFFTAPALIVPFMGWLEKNRSFRASLVFNALVALLVLRVSDHQLTRAYRDLPPLEENATVQVEPYTGLKTSARRAYLINEIGGATKGKHFVFAWHKLPGVFLSGRAVFNR